MPRGSIQDCIKLFGEWLLEWATQNGAFGVNEGVVVTRKAGSVVDEVCKSGPGLTFMQRWRVHLFVIFKSEAGDGVL